MSNEVLRASFCSADTISHALSEYGNGSMGRGIRKLAVENFQLGERQGFFEGVVVTTITVGTVQLGIWLYKRIRDKYQENNKASELCNQKKEEDNCNGKANESN